MRGGPGNDDLRGGRGDDTLQGGDGDDYLEATIFEREPGGVDTVMCGEGVDEVIADAGDTVAADCEDVTIE